MFSIVAMEYDYRVLTTYTQAPLLDHYA